MINAPESVISVINSPVRKIRARVELYNGSTLVDTYSYDDRLISISLERVGDETKFFGYTICQKVNIHLLDVERELDITVDNSFKVYFGVGDNYISNFPTFYVTQCRRNENTNELSITAYDAFYDASLHEVSKLELEAPYTIRDFVSAANSYINSSGSVIWKQDIDVADLEYPDGANIEGTETIREILDDAAEATQTICYINGNDDMIFKRLDTSNESVFTIDKSRYIELDSGDNRRIQTVMHCTELGDNVSASIEAKGSIAYVRDNCFWDLREDIGALVDGALAVVGGMTINQFECSWRGDFLLELGDKIDLVTKDNSVVTSYVLDDVIEYNGTFSQKTRWKYDTSDTETAENPTSLGDALKQTYARVNKVDKQIDFVASDIQVAKENIGSLQINTESITASVKQVQDNVDNALGTLNDSVQTLTQQVQTKMTAEDVQIQIESALSSGDGINSVTTTTGFTFNDTGLTISKSGSEMTTEITEDGMTVYKNNNAVLTANNVGVDAVNLHATTYLIIGTYSRFEDYDGGRTGCFWIGS